MYTLWYLIFMCKKHMVNKQCTQNFVEQHLVKLLFGVRDTV